MSEKQPALREYDFSGQIKKKNGLSYVSWANLWDTALTIDPDATYHIHQFASSDGRTVPYQELGIGVMVYVDVTLLGKTRTGYLPVMDNKNKTITQPTATDINNAIQRCLSKAAAMHGLGLHVYRGEDTAPENDEAREAERAELEKPISDEQRQHINQLMLDTETSAEAFESYLKIDSLDALPVRLYDKAVKALEKKKEKMEATHEAA